MSTSSTVPEIGSPLGLLCACLSVSGRHDALQQALDRRATDWRAVIELANAHFVTPQLADALERNGLGGRVDPEPWEYLQAIRALNRERNGVLRSQLSAISQALNGIGITPLLVKGAIALTPGQYPGASDRIMGDLDIVVPEEGVAEARKVLVSIGYAEASEAWRLMTRAQRQNANHLPPFVHRSLPVCVEIHHRVLLDRKDDAVLAARLRACAVAAEGGARLLVPDPASRLVHNFIHAQIRDELAVRRMVNMRQLYEFASVARHFQGQYTATEICAAVRPRRTRRLAEYWILAERWLGAPLPEGLERPPSAERELWMTGRVMQSRGWRRTSDFLYGALKLPQRVSSHATLMREVPGYPSRLARRVWQRVSGQPLGD